MTETTPIVAIVDDDVSVRESLADLLKELGFETRAYQSAEAFLVSGRVSAISCLILDIALPGMSGPDLFHELRRRRQLVPIVFITAQTDEATRPRLLKEGAVDCLFKPFSEAALLSALRSALRAA